ncbi:MAG: P-II family nitrogen regulator [Deltaproteobacteria bacterium]|nr:P-II family nitrogen regulator [Deltaproteobacteria bacterium]
MKEIKAIIQSFMLDKVCDALAEIDGLPGMTVSEVAGWGRTRARGTEHLVHHSGCRFAKKTKIEIVVKDGMAELVVDSIARSAHTGNVGDGKIFVYEISDALKIRTGHRGEAAV